MSEPVWAIVGGTGTGKTALAVQLAERHGGEIVSVDSAQVFVGLDIGTAKPTHDEMTRARHHLIDVIDANTQWTAAAFADAALAAIDDIRRRGKRPILCGGAGLWYRALLHGVFEAPEIDAELRRQIRADIEAKGAPAIHAELAKVDPVAADKLHPNDKQRIGRALEVFRQTGVPISEFQRRHGFKEQRLVTAAVAIDWPREQLVTRLDQRAKNMFEAGLITEVRGLLDGGAKRNGPGLSCIGYKQAVAVLDGDMTESEALDATQVATRRYAKRQKNWFRAEAVRWLDPTTDIDAIEAVLLQG